MVYRVTVVRRFSCIVFDFIDREEKENKKKKKPVSRLFSVDFFFFFFAMFPMQSQSQRSNTCPSRMWRVSSPIVACLNRVSYSDSNW